MLVVIQIALIVGGVAFLCWYIPTLIREFKNRKY